MSGQYESGPRAVGALRLVGMFLRTRGSSEEFADALAQRALAQLPGSVAGRRVLDLGCGPGVYSAALAAEGAEVISMDRDAGELQRAQVRPARALVADGRRLPFGDASFDAVVCSNVLEHTPDPYAVMSELQRVLVLGGWGYVSWTNWYSPWGGHAVAPLHYLGPERSVRWWWKLFGAPPGPNVPLDGVWPTHIGPTIRWVEERAGLELERRYPRYWPWLAPVMRVPGVREVVTWNCVLVVRRTA